MAEVEFIRPPDEPYERATEERREAIRGRMTDVRDRARKRLRSEGLDDSSIEGIMAAYGRLEDEELEYAGLMTDVLQAQHVTPLIIPEEDYLGRILGAGLQGVGQMVGMRLGQRTETDDREGVLKQAGRWLGQRFGKEEEAPVGLDDEMIERYEPGSDWQWREHYSTQPGLGSQLGGM